MKRLLFISVINMILLIFCSCCINNNKTSSINSNKNNSTYNIDSTNNQLIEIEHKAPNQSEIDSIKRIKTLNKK